MKLQLVDGASEDQVVNAIKTIEDRAYVAETKIIKLEGDHQREIKDIKDKAKSEVDAATKKADDFETAKVQAETELTTIKDSLTKKEKEYNEIKAKYDQMEKEKNEAIAAEKKTKAETMVMNYVKAGRIKDNKDEASKKAIDKFVNLAIDDFDGTEAMIKAIPLVAKAPVIVTEAVRTEGGEAIGGTSAMTLAVRNKMKRQGNYEAAAKVANG